MDDALRRKGAAMYDKNEPAEPPGMLDIDIDEYLKEKDRIRGILGRIGGVPRTPGIVLNVSLAILVAACFVVALIVQEPSFLPFEIAVLLISIKLIYVLRQNAKAIHFQFWMLSTIEWRLNDLAKRLKRAERETGDVVDK